jgi:hypothetical protein
MAALQKPPFQLYASEIEIWLGGIQKGFVLQATKCFNVGWHR